ncbi:hypothetical protein MMYC01_206948 [Madurella mycetomatis]|uniref:Uncharacterized protein n=1 Tax=Madurella mycetomatis TaxID=100816 RepID=A0A175VWW0_9PEZI|nr:hypothetical protein MMYC01_206948 [Madurella mycetomatis]
MAVERKTMKPFLAKLAAATLIKEGLTATGGLWQDNGLLSSLLARFLALTASSVIAVSGQPPRE